MNINIYIAQPAGSIMYYTFRFQLVKANQMMMMMIFLSFCFYFCDVRRTLWKLKSF